MGKQELNLIDPGFLCSCYGLTSEQAERMLDGLEEEILESVSGLKMAEKGSDWQRVRHIAHKQLPAFRMLNVVPMIRICEALLRIDALQPDETCARKGVEDFLLLAQRLQLQLHQRASAGGAQFKA